MLFSYFLGFFLISLLGSLSPSSHYLIIWLLWFLKIFSNLFPTRLYFLGRISILSVSTILLCWLFSYLSSCLLIWTRVPNLQSYFAYPFVFPQTNTNYTCLKPNYSCCPIDNLPSIFPAKELQDSLLQGVPSLSAWVIFDEIRCFLFYLYNRAPSQACFPLQMGV